MTSFMSLWSVLCITFALTIPVQFQTRHVLIPDDCEGCAKQSNSSLNGKIQITQQPSVGNGQCNGTSSPCTRVACAISGTLKIKNVSGGDLFWREGLTGALVTLGNNDTDTWTYSAGDVIDCFNEDGSVQVRFWDNAEGAGPPCAIWQWKCTKCPTV